jgi:hypothetical protein
MGSPQQQQQQQQQPAVQPSAIEAAGLWSRISFSWVGPLIHKGWHSLQLERDDARFLLPQDTDVPQLSQQFEAAYGKLKVGCTAAAAAAAAAAVAAAGAAAAAVDFCLCFLLVLVFWVQQQWQDRAGLPVHNHAERWTSSVSIAHCSGLCWSL